jgi:hypothetical protein
MHPVKTKRGEISDQELNNRGIIKVLTPAIIKPGGGGSQRKTGIR